MRGLERNKQSLYYCNYKSKDELKDEKGFFTGEFIITYDHPKLLKASITLAKGYDEMQQYGTSFEYDKTIICDNVNLNINENTIFFIDKEPIFDYDNNTLLNTDYIITRIAKSFNVLLIFVKKVKNNEYINKD